MLCLVARLLIAVSCEKSPEKSLLNWRCGSGFLIQCASVRFVHVFIFGKAQTLHVMMLSLRSALNKPPQARQQKPKIDEKKNVKKISAFRHMHFTVNQIRVN